MIDQPPAFAIVDLRERNRGDPYITLWRPDNAGYAWPLPWAGRYSLAAIEASPTYYCARRGGRSRAFDRWPVPWSVVQRLAVDPAPGRIDGNAGPVLRNDARTRRALRRYRFIPSTLLAARQVA